MLKHRGLILCLVFLCTLWAKPSAQDRAADAFIIQEIFATGLNEGQCYPWLQSLTQDVGHRLAGSEGAERAVGMMYSILDTLKLDSVWLQPCRVSHWYRGEPEVVRVISNTGETTILRALALGNSVGTAPDGISAGVIEVQGLEDLAAMPEAAVEGKVVFFNRPMRKDVVNTFYGYGRAVDQRWSGPRAAAEKGAVAAVVRSMTTAQDTFPHTGSTDYRGDGSDIPAVAISTVDADLLSHLLRTESVQLYIRTTCTMLDSVTSHNVIGEIRGSESPDEIILVGGHLDSWDVGAGAHDDGSGCVQAMDVLYLLRKIGYIPRRTIRCVLFMNEENGLAGAKAYAKMATQFHLAAIESDAGGFLPLGFGMGAEGTLQEKYFKDVRDWWGLIEPYDLNLAPGGGGADVSQLRSQGGMLFGMRTNSQRYFDYHHTWQDTFDKVHRRELRIGAAAMTSLVFLLDKYAIRRHE